MQHGAGVFYSSGITKWEDKTCVTSQEILRTNLFAVSFTLVFTVSKDFLARLIHGQSHILGSKLKSSRLII